MSIENYADLKTAVASYLNRSDLTSQIPDFIALGEQRIFYGSDAPFASQPVRVPAMQGRETGSITGSVIAFPDDFIEVIRLAGSSGGFTWTMDYVSPPQFDQSSAGLPTTYTYLNNQIQTAGTGSASYTLDYYARFSALSADSDTNWVLTNAPGVYLYAALLEASPYLQDANVQGWYAMYKSAVGALNRATTRHGSGLAARVVR